LQYQFQAVVPEAVGGLLVGALNLPDAGRVQAETQLAIEVRDGVTNANNACRLFEAWLKDVSAITITSRPAGQ
jgi:hypothetical protein